MQGGRLRECTGTLLSTLAGPAWVVLVGGDNGEGEGSHCITERDVGGADEGGFSRG